MGAIIKLMMMLLIGLFVFRMVLRLLSGTVFLSKSSGAKNESKTADIELTPCAYCGTHIYAKQAVTSKGKVFCSKEHALKHKQSSLS